MEDGDVHCLVQGCLHLVLLWERKFYLWFTWSHCSLMGSASWKVTGKLLILYTIMLHEMHFRFCFITCLWQLNRMQLAILDHSSYFLFPMKPTPWITWNPNCLLQSNHYALVVTSCIFCYFCVLGMVILFNWNLEHLLPPIHKSI